MKNRQKFYDRLAGFWIRLGGAGLIVAVLGIFIFMAAQTLPLFFGAQVAPRTMLELIPETYRFLGLDEWGERPFVMTAEGELLVYSSDFLDGVQTAPERFRPFATQPSLAPQAWDEAGRTFLFGDSQGQIALLNLLWARTHNEETPKVEVKLVTSPIWSLGEELKAPWAFQVGEVSTLILAVKNGQENNAEESKFKQTQIAGFKLDKRESLLGETSWEIVEKFSLPLNTTKPPQYLKLNPSQDILLVGFQDGEVQYWQRAPEGFAFREAFYPLGRASQSSNSILASMDFLHGGGSVYFTDYAGKNVIWSLLIPEGEKERRWVQIQDFPDLANKSDSQNVTSFAKSLRNRAFLVSRDNEVSLRYGTSGEIRWQQEFLSERFPLQKIIAVALNEKYHTLAVLTGPHQLHLFDLQDPHPEAGLKSFFSKIWYEGASQPEYTWQSTGGSDSFEPKLSVIPLLIGTLKGTFYSLLFAVPIALLAALYTSEFLNPNFKHWLKALMEIMASLPSVILGFLAALWLAPHLEHAIPALILMILGFPILSLAAAFLWNLLGGRLPEKYEWIYLLPVLVTTGVLAWYGGPILERWLFTVQDPVSGATIADFPQWWRSFGASYEMRNAVVVGSVMGFAVIPLIFTLAEDAFAAVPKGLRSASLALGASSWQTALRVVWPTAVIGVFSAVMIGVGRAIGETMIVLMATGNTPLLDFNPFSGMRTLSANLAVELPEAPYQGTLYRTLFLGATLLFLLTFSVNSLAELMRERIRKKVGG